MKESYSPEFGKPEKPMRTIVATLRELAAMDFPLRLTSLRKARSLTQQHLADEVGIHVTQLRRYEAGTAQPTLNVLRKLAISLQVSADALLFDQQERGPADDLRFQFEALANLDPSEREVVKSVLEGLLLKHQARRLAEASR